MTRNLPTNTRWLLPIAVLVTLGLYGRSLALPLYMDDVIYGRYASGVTLPELFYHLNIVPYYRPLSLVPWKLLELLNGHYPAAVMHALNLVVHILNGWLVGVLARRCSGRAGIALVAALLYLTFPFTYQAVPWAAALGHLLALCGVLLALLSFDHWQRTRSPRALIAVWLSVALAVFGHENGIVAGGVVLLYWLVFSPRTLKLSAASRLFAPLVVITLVFVAIWLQLPKDRGAFQFSLSDIAQNALYFSQGLTYPVAWLVNRLGLGDPAGMSDHAGALLALVITGGVFALTLRFTAAARRVMLFGLLWYAAAAAVPVIFLPHAYAIDGPRLMLLASGGAALVWASLADGLIRARVMIGRVVAVAVAALIVILGGAFILQRMALHDQLAAVYRTIWNAGDRDAVFVNLPAWQAYQRREFPMGSEGITYLTDYIGFPDLVLVNTGYWGDSLAVERADLRPEFPGYYFGNASPSPGADEIAAAIEQRGQGYLFTNIADRAVWFSAQRVEASLDDQSFAWTNGVRAQVEMPLSDDLALFPVVITWQADDPVALADDLTAFVHLQCGGALVSQSDGAPLRGALPFRAWRAGETWREQRYLPAVDDMTGCQLVLGLYSGVTGERVVLVNGGDAVALPVGGG